MTSIPPFVLQVIGVLLRSAVLLVIGWVAAHGGPTFTDDQVVKFVAEATPVLAIIAWSVYTKYFGRLKLNTALFQAQKTEKQLEAQVRDPDYPTPSVLTQKHEIPQIK